jgi:lysosomal Pro-X carboxypeptidase
MAMTDYSGPSNFLQPMPAYPVVMACSNITNILNISDYTEVFPAVINGANVYYNYSGTNTCNELNLNIGSSLGNQGWDYLACTTLNMPIGSNGVSDMFWNAPWDQNSVDSQCLQTWGEATQVNYPQLWYGTSRNTSYILRHASNILFSSGSLDPWQSGSVRENYNQNLIVFTMLGAAHHSELRAPATTDLPSVTNGRVVIRQAIQYWVNGTIS